MENKMGTCICTGKGLPFCRLKNWKRPMNISALVAVFRRKLEKSYCPRSRTLSIVLASGSGWAWLPQAKPKPNPNSIRLTIINSSQTEPRSTSPTCKNSGWHSWFWVRHATLPVCFVNVRNWQMPPYCHIAPHQYLPNPYYCLNFHQCKLLMWQHRKHGYFLSA